MCDAVRDLANEYEIRHWPSPMPCIASRAARGARELLRSCPALLEVMFCSVGSRAPRGRGQPSCRSCSILSARELLVVVPGPPIKSSTYAMAYHTASDAVADARHGYLQTRPSSPQTPDPEPSEQLDVQVASQPPTSPRRGGRGAGGPQSAAAAMRVVVRLHGTVLEQPRLWQRLRWRR